MEDLLLALESSKTALKDKKDKKDKRDKKGKKDKKDKKRNRIEQEPEERALEPAQKKLKKEKKKSKDKERKVDCPQPDAVAKGDEATQPGRRDASVASTVSEASSTGAANPDHYVSLADRLNPTRRGYDADFKARWADMPKHERQLLVKQDKQMISGMKTATATIKHPFETNEDDHCETSGEAYKDIVPLLELLAERLGKTKTELAIYDPYYCAGAMKRHMAAVGFPNVYNECEDFYEKLKDPTTLPPHDILITNPPYGEEHVRKLLKFCVFNEKPFLLLLPDYICCKDFYLPCLGSEDAQEGEDTPAYLVPGARYVYWTPHGLRDLKNKKSHRNLPLGIRTSPFPSFWHVSLRPAVTKKALRKWWGDYERSGKLATFSKPPKLFASTDKLPTKIPKS